MYNIIAGPRVAKHLIMLFLFLLPPGSGRTAQDTLFVEPYAPPPCPVQVAPLEGGAMAALLERGAQTSARGCLERDADHILKTDLFFHAFVDHVPARGRVLVRAFVDLVLVSELNRIRGAEILLRFASVLEESGYYALSAEVIGRCIEEPGIFAGPCLLARVQRRDRDLLGLLEES